MSDRWRISPSGAAMWRVVAMGEALKLLEPIERTTTLTSLVLALLYRVALLERAQWELR